MEDGGDEEEEATRPPEVKGLHFQDTSGDGPQAKGWWTERLGWPGEEKEPRHTRLTLIYVISHLANRFGWVPQKLYVVW